MSTRTGVLLCGLLLVAGPLCAGASDAFTADIEALTRGSHRLTGTEEGRAALDYVAQRLSAMTPDRIVTQQFSVVQMRVKRCEVKLPDGRVLALKPMRPNGIIPPVTPLGGLQGVLVDGGDGLPEQFLDRSVVGSIVVLDYNSGENWLRAFRLGARAIIFVGADDAEAWHAHQVDVNVNMPRFFYAGSREDLVVEGEVAIHSEMVWESRVGRNLFAFYKGRDPTFSQEQEEVIVLAAPLDSYGEVPELSPGARGAANVAGLLKLAEQIQAHRPRRHMLLAFLDAQAQGHRGVGRFYHALDEKHPDATVEGRQKFLDEEAAFLDELWALVSKDKPLTHDSSARRDLLRRLKDRAKERAFEVMDLLSELRTERTDLQAAIEQDGDDPAKESRKKEITQEVEQKWEPQKDEWNDVRRALGKDRTDALKPALSARVDSLMTDVREDVRLRREELELGRRALADDTELNALLKDTWIALHVSLLLGDTTPRWGLVVGGDSKYHSWDDIPGLYGKVQGVFLRACDTLEARGEPPALFERATADQSLPNTRVLWGAPHLIHSGEVAGTFGMYNLCFATAQESLAREGTPADTIARLDAARIEAQVDEIGRLLAEAADLDIQSGAEDRANTGTVAEDLAPGTNTWAVASQEGLSLRRGIAAHQVYSQAKFSGESVTGPTVMGLLPGSSVPDMRMAGAIVQFPALAPATRGFSSRKPYAFENFRVYQATRNGTFDLGPIRDSWLWFKVPGFAAIFDSGGRVSAVSDSDSATSTGGWRLNVFEGRPGWMVLPPPLKIKGAATLSLLSARDNGVVDTKKSFLHVGDGVAGWYVHKREEGIKLFNLDLAVALNSGPQLGDGVESEPLGVGFDTRDAWQPFPSSRRSALDLWRLNESRLSLLQGKNIIDSSLAELHGRSEDYLLKTAGDPVTLRSEAVEVSSFMASRAVYTRTRQIVDDLVFAVLILLGIAVPFAFAVERVTIGATTVYRQMLGFFGVFVATFITLFLTHPAFAIANTPIIIFLGFTVLIMSLVVIAIIMRRFETELKVLQGMPATVHGSDVSRASTLLAATQMGISTMRRRPLRTTLTAVTIILLTFTILNFASFGTQSGVVRFFAAPVPAYKGVFVHDVNWAELGGDIMDVVRGRWADEHEVFERRWISPVNRNDAGLLLTRRDGTYPVSIKGVLGMEPGEIARRPDLAALLDESLEGRILLTPAVARAISVVEGDEVLLAGVPLRVGRLMDPVEVSVATDMDGSSILPVDFTEARSQTAQEQSVETALLEQVNWTSLPVDSVAVVSTRVATRLGAKLRGWSVYTRDIAAAAAAAEDMARMLEMSVAATLENGVYRHVLGTVVAASGASDLLFPILLGGLVIFGTMLGSVADREREIYTFSALGLAPRHVATLFVAEAIVYSLIGGMGGYLLAQAVLRVMTALAGYGLVQAPEMNMSSTNTIVTILIVMCTVMVSAIYPAIKASKSANPGLMRTWKLPEPEGNLIDMVFPFTVSDYDITGVVSFLKEHFDNHSEVGLGQFMARDTQIVRDADGVLGVHSHLTLAPFDLGVSQDFVMRSTPSEIPGIDEVQIRLERETGQPKDWHRLNRVLLNDLRQQFLIWRALPEETMDVYRQKTLVTLGKA